uniref:Gastrin-releasing peptide n=2 Tax=Boreoeutheria TaxID=1437010 RepID=A0A9L0TKM2_HORSE
MQQWRGRRRRSSSEVRILPSLLRGESALSAQPSRGAPRASRRDHARLRAPARPAGAGPLPGAPGASRSGVGGRRDRAGQDVPARQPLGGGCTLFPFSSLAGCLELKNKGEGGHLMGKKSTGESPDVYEGQSVKQQLREHIQWEEAARNLLSLLEAKGSRSHQSPQWEPLGVGQSALDSEESSNFKDLVDSLLQVLNVKEGTPS